MPMNKKTISGEYTYLCPGNQSGTRLEEDGVSGEPEVAARCRARRVSVPAHMLGAQMKAATSMASLIAVRHLPIELHRESAQGVERGSVLVAQFTKGAESTES